MTAGYKQCTINQSKPISAFLVVKFLDKVAGVLVKMTRTPSILNFIVAERSNSPFWLPHRFGQIVHNGHQPISDNLTETVVFTVTVNLILTEAPMLGQIAHQRAKRAGESQANETLIIIKKYLQIELLLILF